MKSVNFDDLQSAHLALALGRRSISRTLLTSFQFRLQTGGVIGRESDSKAAINDFASFSSRIAKFAVMLDVAISPPFVRLMPIISNFHSDQRT